MKVFISWSKQPSRSIATALRNWLGGLVQAAELWMSDEEIGSGQRWRDELATVLNDAHFGIICLTRSNQCNPWLMFETGALAKQLTAARVIPLCIDLDPAEVTGPLSDWQGRPLNQNGMWRVVHDINQLTLKPMPEKALRRLFDRMWPDFEAEVATVKAQAALKAQAAPQPATPSRSLEDMMHEVLDGLRRIEHNQATPPPTLSRRPDLPQRVPGEPDITIIVDGNTEPMAETPALASIAAHLRGSDWPQGLGDRGFGALA